MDRFAWLLAAIVLTAASAASGEIYRWTDAEGTLHFSEDLSRVPPEHRAAARSASREPAPTAVQTYATPQRVDDATTRTSGRAVQVPFERRGTLMLVSATVNESTPVPFLIDTGASGIALPARLARDLGVRVGPDTERISVTTANGVIRVPIVRLDSVDLGGARVEGLYATLNPSIEVGLLGGSFFNNYEYSVDAAASVITLRPNDRVRGGAAADQWRQRFQELRSNIARLESYLQERDVTRDNRRRALEQSLVGLQEQLAELEREANRAGVPQPWRR